MEKLCNPMFETMERCKKFEDQISQDNPREIGNFVHLTQKEIDILQSAFINYGHYLDEKGREMMKEFLAPYWGGEDTSKWHRFPKDRETASSYLEEFN